MIVMSTRFLLKNGLMCRKSTKLPMLEAQSFTTDFLRVNFTEFLSIFYFSFLLLISVLSSYKKSVRIAADSLASLSNDPIQGFWLNDQMILRCYLLFTIKIHCSRRCYYAFFHLFHYYIFAANQVLSQNFIDIIWRE